jgi:hypothetical protein
MPLVLTQGYGSGGGSPPLLVSVVASTGQVTITFNGAVVLTGDSLVTANWSIVANDDASSVAITAVSEVGGAVVLSTAETGTGRTYTLTIPSGIYSLVTGGYFFPTSTTFSGAGTGPTIALARAIDSVSLEVIFSEAVRSSDALTAGNYNITNGLTISGVAQINSTTYRLTTSQMVSGQSYLLTASNIRDAAGNPI